MLTPGFEAAYLPAPRGRGSDPGWLDGIAAGRPAFLLGGAGGLVESPGLAAARGQISIGTNWTLRAVVPSLWLVVDASVWKSESSRLVGCPDSMGVVVGSNIFGGGVFSTAHARRLKMVGRGERRIAEIRIQPAHGAKRDQKGQIRFNVVPPFAPRSARDVFHPSANSLCYAIQLACVMGCSPIYAVGFTLQNGLGYFFGRSNPVTKRTTVYEQERALEWCRWHARQFPARVQLDPSFQGPVYDIFPKANFDEVQAPSGSRPPDDRGQQPESPHADATQVEPVRLHRP
jgi:hypothetical protein